MIFDAIFFQHLYHIVVYSVFFDTAGSISNKDFTAVLFDGGSDFFDLIFGRQGLKLTIWNLRSTPTASVLRTRSFPGITSRTR